MPRNHSRASKVAAKPKKPYPEFPLFAHVNGQWAKKIRGKHCFFGVWADPDKALANYLAKKDELHFGRKPRCDPDAISIKDVASCFHGSRLALVESGELSQRTYDDYAVT